MVDREVAECQDRHNLHRNYFRLNVPQGMRAIGLAEWDKLKQMIAITNRHMGHCNVHVPYRACHKTTV
jgi:hypothetical protein